MLDTLCYQQFASKTTLTDLTNAPHNDVTLVVSHRAANKTRAIAGLWVMYTINHPTIAPIKQCE